MSKDELPSISDYGKNRDDLPSYKDFLEKKEENLPSVEDFIEKKVVAEETQIVEDLEVTDDVSAPDWSQLVRLINDVRKDIPEIPEIKYYDEELERILQSIEEIKGNIPEVVYYDQDISSLKEEIGQVKDQIPEVPDVRYYEGDIEYIHTKINLVKEEISKLPEVKYYDEDVESLRAYIGEVKDSIPTFPDWVQQVQEVPDFSWIGKTFSCIDDDFNKVQGHLDLIREKIKFEVSDLNETIDTKEFEFKVDLKNLGENGKETEDKIWKEFRETSIRIWDHHNEYKDDDRKLKKQILGEYNLLKQKVKKEVEDYNEQNSKYQQDLLTRFSFVEEKVDNLDVRYYDEDIESIQKDVASAKTDINTLFRELKKIAEDIKTNQQELKENYLLNEPPGEKERAGGQSDPLTPLDQNFATLEDLSNHYRLFLARITTQLATMGGGGAGFIKDLDDVSFDESTGNNKLLIYNSSINKWVGITSTELPSSKLVLDVRNNNVGYAITIGTPVYEIGFNSGQDRLNVEESKANDSTTMPAKGVVSTNLANNTNGEIIVYGELEGVDTSAFDVADELYVAPSGGLTNVRPSDPTHLVQKIAVVLKKSAANGAILVYGAGRTNDVPNNISIAGSVTASDFYKIDGTPIGGVGAAGTWGIDSVGIHTVKSVGIGTTSAKTGKALFVVGDGEFTGNVSVAGTLTYEDVTNIDSVGLVTARTGVRIVGGGLTVTGVSTFHSDVSFESNINGNVTIVSTDTGSAAAPELTLYRNSASPAPGDYLGQLMFKGENSNGGQENYAKITGKITDETLGTEDGLIETAIKGAGSFTIVSRQRSDELQLLNGVGLSVDGTSTFDDNVTINANISHTGTAVFGSSNGIGTVHIGIGTTALLVEGSARITGILTVGKGSVTIDGDNNIINTGIVTITNSNIVIGDNVTLSGTASGINSAPNVLYVAKDGNDANNGTSIDNAKLTIASAVGIAQSGTVIKVLSGNYVESNPIELPAFTAIVGDDLRTVKVLPSNTTQDIFHVNKGTKIANITFSGHLAPAAAVAFPTGIATNVGGGKWKGPYIQNCTSDTTTGTGIYIDGNLAEKTKSMNVDAFTQYNQGGVGVAVTNEGYAQLVSVFTICCDKAITVHKGAQADLANSNCSFGTFGLVADGVGPEQYTGVVTASAAAAQDNITINVGAVTTRPYDGQVVYFDKLYKSVQTISVGSGGTGYTQAPTVTIDAPTGPSGETASAFATIENGSVTEISIISSGSQYETTPTITISGPQSGINTATATANMADTYYTINSATPIVSGITTLTLAENLINTVGVGSTAYFFQQSKIVASSHTFEYIGSGNTITLATPKRGGVTIQANEVVSQNGGKVIYTSTDQSGNFRIGDDLQINQATGTISGRAFSKSLFSEMTPFILALS